MTDVRNVMSSIREQMSSESTIANPRGDIQNPFPYGLKIVK